MTLIRINKDIPLFGCIAFGIIDRGTNLIQVRPTSKCNLKCIYCSVSANDTKIHPYEFEVEPEYLVSEVRKVAELKGNIEVNIDSVGEPLIYPRLAELIREIKKINGVEFISMQTNATLLTKEKVDELVEAGLGRFNFSINTTDNEELARKMTNYPDYDLKKIVELAEYISTKKTELLLAPIWVPGINDEEIPKLIEFAKKLKCKIGIQKYDIYKYSRKPKGVKKITYWKFYRQLEELEKIHNMKLKLGPIDFKIRKAKRVPIIFRQGDKVNVVVKLPGWIRGEMIGVAKERCISILNCDKKINQRVNVRIISNTDGNYVAR